MTPNPTVSVLSAWYNRPHDIETSVRSVLDQEDVDFEYVVVDDASDDGETFERLARLAEDPRMRLVRNERNLGFTRSLLKAVAMARGRYLALQDAGDLSLPGRLSAQARFLAENPDHVAVGGEVTDLDLATGRRTRVPTRQTDRYLGVDGFVFTHGEVMVRRAAYEAAGGYRELFYYSQDSDLWRRLAEHGRLGHVPRRIYERRVFADGVQGDGKRRLMQAVFGNLGLVCAQARAEGKPDPVERRNAAALLDQPHNERFKRAAYEPLLQLLRAGRGREAAAALSVVPAGLLTTKMLSVYLMLRLLFPGAARAPADAATPVRSRILALVARLSLAPDPGGAAEVDGPDTAGRPASPSTDPARGRLSSSP